MEFCATYQHTLPTPSWETLLNMAALVRQYVSGIGGPTNTLTTMIVDLWSLPFDEDGNRIMEIGFSDHEAITALLDWAALKAPGKPYAELARQLRSGAEDADRAVVFQSSCN
jgi:hypothetical protein